MKRRKLRTRIALSLLVYSISLGGAILGLGFVTNEQVETLVWQALLTREASYLEERRSASKDRPISNGTIKGYVVADGAQIVDEVPREVLALSEGLHDEVDIGGHEFAVMVKHAGHQTIYTLIDISELEANERSLTGWLMLAATIALTLLVVGVWWLSGRLLRPVSDLASTINGLGPDHYGQRVPLLNNAAAEISVIVGALNALFDRIDGFVVRERTFINIASHELRTPIAVINCAIEVVAERTELPDAMRKPIERVRRAAREIEQLVDMLLVLAKAPNLLRDSATAFALDDLVRDVVEDHFHLTEQKALRLELGRVEAVTLNAPIRIAQVAIANLLRNAIENSDAGVVAIEVAQAGIVTIEDPGHGMSAEEIGRLYAALARRNDSTVSFGIGLDLIGRICQHMGWTLDIVSREGAGTRMTLDFGASIVRLPGL